MSFIPNIVLKDRMDKYKDVKGVCIMKTFLVGN